MYQIDNSTAAQTIPASTAVGSKGYFTDGNPATGTPATILPAEFMNMLMMENLNVLVAAGIQPDKNKFNQLALAISTITGSNLAWANITGKPTTLLGYGITDTYNSDQTNKKITEAISSIGAATPTAFGLIRLATQEQVDQGTDAYAAVTSATLAKKVTSIDAATKTELNNGLAGKQDSLGFVPVQQGGGVGQSTNKIKIGWDSSSLRLTVDNNDLGRFWLSSNFDPNTKADKSYVDAGLATKPIGDGISYVGFASNDTSKPYMRSSVNGNVYYMQPSLGFTPVQQGTGIGQTSNIVKIGWSSTTLKATVDNVDLGEFLLTSNCDLTGAIVHFTLSLPPLGFLKANGTAVSRTQYAKLFAKIGTFYGAGDGSTTFNLPDLRGEFVRCWDDGRGVDANRGFGSSQAQDIQPHTHAIYATGNDTSYGRQGTGSGPGDYVAQTASTGTTETRPRNVALLACIKY